MSFKISAIEAKFLKDGLFIDLFHNEIKVNALGNNAFVVEDMLEPIDSYDKELESQYDVRDIKAAMQIRNHIFKNKEKFCKFVRLNRYGYFQ